MKPFSIVAILLVTTLLGLGIWLGPLIPQGPSVTVVHWTNSHLTGDGLLPDMAEQFNEAGYKTQSGKRIEVEVYRTGSASGAEDLLSRVVHGRRINPELPDPIIFTPHVDHWLVQVNHSAGRTVVDNLE